MRRSDREIKNKQEMLDVMRKCDVCRLAFHEDALTAELKRVMISS